MSAPDPAKLAERLRDYDETAPRCLAPVASRRWYGPDNADPADPANSEFWLEFSPPCWRAAGHSGPCKTGRPLLGWPGYDALAFLIATAQAAMEPPK